MAISHAGCTHPRTPAGRRACRAGNAPVSAERRLAESAGLVPNRRPQRASEAVRIQPRRSGARVAIDASGCVQAALHTGRGKCACGWENWGAA